MLGATASVARKINDGSPAGSPFATSDQVWPSSIERQSPSVPCVPPGVGSKRCPEASQVAGPAQATDHIAAVAVALGSGSCAWRGADAPSQTKRPTSVATRRWALAVGSTAMSRTDWAVVGLPALVATACTGPSQDSPPSRERKSPGCLVSKGSPRPR